MKKQSWKKRTLSIVLCVAMMLSMNAQAFAVGIDITDNGTYLDEKQSDVKSDAQVDAVEALCTIVNNKDTKMGYKNLQLSC